MSSNCTLEETNVRERNLLSHIANMILAANENALVIGGLTAPGQQDCEKECFLKIIKNSETTKNIFFTRRLRLRMNGVLTTTGQQDCEWEFFLKTKIIKNKKYIFHTEAEIENERSLDRNWSTGERWEWARRNGFQRGKVALCHQPFSLLGCLFVFFLQKTNVYLILGRRNSLKIRISHRPHPSLQFSLPSFKDH